MLDQIQHILSDLPGFLDTFVKDHGVLVYVLLGGIVFVETGLVIWPFLPGDSLLFAVGAVSARPGTGLDPWIAAAVLIAAAIIGDTTNYFIGKAVGPRVMRGDGSTLLGRLFSRKHLDRAHAFYEKHGGKAVIIGRFVPIVRTFVPFVAGAGAMTYRKFLAFSVVGTVLWVGICLGAGVLFGNMEFVQKNFEAVVIGVIAVSLIPITIEALRHKFASRPSTTTAVPGSAQLPPDPTSS